MLIEENQNRSIIKKAIFPSIMVLLACSLLPLDYRLSRAIQSSIHSYDCDFLNSFFLHITHLGRLGLFFFAFAFFLLLSYPLNDNTLKQKMKYALIALTIPGIASRILKIIIGRHRPHIVTDFDPFIFEPFKGLSYNLSSMPSGHSCIAGALTVIFCNIFPKFRWLWIPAGLLIASSRIWLDVHFPSDTAIGFTLGIITATITTKIYKKKQSTTKLIPKD